ncbi:hypothetical protein D3C71_1824150 [compost metagenome]
MLAHELGTDLIEQVAADGGAGTHADLFIVGFGVHGRHDFSRFYQQRTSHRLQKLAALTQHQPLAHAHKHLSAQCRLQLLQ